MSFGGRSICRGRSPFLHDRRRFRKRCFRWRTGRSSPTFWSYWNSIISRISLLWLKVKMQLLKLGAGYLELMLIVYMLS
ncbi:hypothetical protein CsatB_014980 [Cannabis sativa]